MQLISKYNNGIKFLLCVIDVLANIQGYKICMFVSLYGKKGATVINAFKSILNDSKGKLDKRWVDQSSKFYNRSFKTWLGITLCSTQNEQKSVVG